MRSNLPFILQRRAENLANNGTPVFLEWNVVTGGTFDPVSRSVLDGVVTRQSKTIQAFVHSVSPAATGVRRFNEVETGDCIIDLAPDSVWPGGPPGWVLNETTGAWHLWTARTNEDAQLEYQLTTTGATEAEACAAPTRHPGWVMNTTTGLWHRWRARQSGDDVLEYFLDATGQTPEAMPITFTIAGQKWVQKEIGGTLARTWDAVMAGQRIYQTLLLRRAT